MQSGHESKVHLRQTPKSQAVPSPEDTTIRSTSQGPSADNGWRLQSGHLSLQNHENKSCSLNSIKSIACYSSLGRLTQMGNQSTEADLCDENHTTKCYTHYLYSFKTLVFRKNTENVLIIQKSFTSLTLMCILFTTVHRL